MKYKLIALDLDGTLNTDEKTITRKPGMPFSEHSSRDLS